MSIEITHVRYSGTQKTHESITDYKWVDREGGGTGSSTKPNLVAWLDNNNVAVVGSGAQQVRVGSVHPERSPAYLRTYADKIWTNNLLSLPTF
jgi:hypothetical protein